MRPISIQSMRSPGQQGEGHAAIVPREVKGTLMLPEAAGVDRTIVQSGWQFWRVFSNPFVGATGILTFLIPKQALPEVSPPPHFDGCLVL